MKLVLLVGGPCDLNIYSVGFNSESGAGLLGYATFPWDYTTNPKDDGVVIQYSTGGCAGSGDYVDDIPAEAMPASGCPETIPDTCSQSGVDPIHNYMDYTIDSCMWEFTRGQMNRTRSQMAVYRLKLPDSSLNIPATVYE
ncbi:Extracellular metalloprotease [Mycena venus]|uniref:Extracellular metalloprotease n=1 Tax=Mycena venus TaxID=2733690 RepID=A0A8H6YFY6_9AGAR|nr:Extracellular metalloprotease [Mycena venus]